MAVLLATLAALSYGLSDFVGGLVSRRTSAWSVAFLGQIASTACTALFAAFRPSDPTAADFAWAALAGVGGGIGTGFLYRGLSQGRMGVVAPVSAVGAAIVPVIVGTATGDRPALLVWIGIAVALPGIWMVSTEPERDGSLADGLLDGALAGLGFGVLFAAIGQVPESSGIWPVAFAQGVGVVTAVAVAVALRADWVPRAPVVAWSLVVGALGAAAAVLFLLATQHGYLTIAGVITSLYPAATVVLAATVLRERIHGVQALGLVLCAGAIALVAAG